MSYMPGLRGEAAWSADGGAPGRFEVDYLWFGLYRRGGRVILHHSHIRPVLVRGWSPSMDGIEATIWASQTTLDLRGAVSGPAARQAWREDERWSKDDCPVTGRSGSGR
jgi:hypothetical protein